MSTDKNNLSTCNCTEANCFCDKVQYDEAQQWEISQLREHLQRCTSCKEYSEKNTKLTSLLKKAKLNNLSDEERKKLKADIAKALQSQQDN